MAMYYAGIDLGTTNSSIAVYREGRPETLLVEGSKITPSVVNFGDLENVIVGERAKRKMLVDPDHTISSVKRKMGKLGFKYNIYGKINHI